MAPRFRFLLPASLLILFLALLAAEAKAPLSNKHTLQTEDESEGNALESDSLDSLESLDNPDFNSSPGFVNGDGGNEEPVDEYEGAEENEDEDDEFPLQKKAREAARTSAEELEG